MKRGKQNKILRIKGGDNIWIEDEDNVIGEFEEYFQKLFSTSGVKDWGDILDEIPVLVNKEINMKLVRKVIEEEVTGVVFQLGHIRLHGLMVLVEYFIKSFGV